MNDFESVGYYAFTMDFDNFHTIYQAKDKVDDKTVIMGIGTGIGVVFINDHHNKN
jgi:glucokinase